MAALQVLDGELWQWDTGREVEVVGCEQVHFAKSTTGTCYTVAVADSKAKIPDELLQAAGRVYAWAYITDEAYGGRTRIEALWDVKRRAKPAEYIYEPSDQRTIKDAETARDEAKAAQKAAEAARDRAVAAEVKGARATTLASGSEATRRPTSRPRSPPSPTFAMKKLAGMDPKSAGVEFVEGPPGSIIGAVRDGRADVGVVFEWDASIAAAQHGLQVVYGFAEPFGPILLTSLMVKEDYLKSNADTVQRFCNALSASMKLIREQSSAYVAAMAAEFPSLDKGVVNSGCERLLSTKGFVPLNPIVSKQEWDMMMEHDTVAGTIRKSLSFEEMVDNRFAEKATADFGLKG